MRLLPAIAVAALLGASAAARADDLTIGITQYPATLNPNIESMLAKTYVEAMTLRPLTHYDQDWQVTCFVCVEVPTIENGLAKREPLKEGGEGMAVTFTLPPGATWGDGVPVTTDDVLFTWEVGRHPQSGVSNAELYRRILDITAKDEKTFTIHTDRVTFDYNSFADFRPLPAHIERPIFESDPAQYRNRTAFDTDPTNPGLAFGPYRIASLRVGSEIVLEKNPTWWGKPPAFDRITVRTIENTAALEANLLSGGIDMIAGELGLELDQALAFEKRHRDRYKVIFKPGLIYEHIDNNLDNPILADRRVRQALLYGADRKLLTDQLFAGHQPVADSFMSPLDWAYSDAVPHYPYDPKKAAALLDEAGWRMGAGGLRRNAKGEVLRLELLTTAGNRTRELVQQVLQSQWRQLGIDVRLGGEPARVFFGETVTKRKFSAMALFAWLSSPENVPRTTLDSEQIPTAANGWAGQNTTGYVNPRVDELIDELEVELDREKRRVLWAELQTIYATDLPALPLYWRSEAYVLPKWLEGVRPTGHQGTTTLWVEDWRRAGG